jgi:hypothetical protein
MTTSSVFWVVVFAASGGVIVFVGLLMERFSEKEWHKNLSDFRRCKSTNVWGEWIVMVGILIEIGVGIFSAIEVWENEPANRPIRDMSALVSFRVKGGNFKEVDFKALTHGGVPWIAFLNVCETNDQPSDLMPATLFSESFSRGYVGKPIDSDRMYSMRFEPERIGSHIPTARPAKEITKIHKIIIGTWFLPDETEVLGGNISLLINSEIEMNFQIPPQKCETNSGFAGIPIIFATNTSPASLIRSGSVESGENVKIVYWPTNE